MTWKIDNPVRVGSLLCAGISETGMEEIGQGTHGWKVPRLIIWVTETTAMGMDFKGNRYSADEIDLAYPSAIASLREQFSAA